MIGYQTTGTTRLKNANVGLFFKHIFANQIVLNNLILALSGK